MFFLPIGCLIFLAFILFLPVLLILGYFHIVTVGFEKLGIPPATTTILLFLILIGSAINIPLKRKLVYVEQPKFFGLFRVPEITAQGIAINLGGAIIPVLICLYFILRLWQQGFSLGPIIVATLLMTVVSKFSARVIPGKGISLPLFIPPLLSAILALILAPGFAAPCAFIAGVLGTLIGADVLNLRKVQKYGGYLSIGGAGVFDGIFLIGIVSAFLAGF